MSRPRVAVEFWEMLRRSKLLSASQIALAEKSISRDDIDGPLDIAGNPNVLTLDVGSSAFSQGCSAHTCLVAIERYEGNAPRPADLAHSVAAAE